MKMKCISASLLLFLLFWFVPTVQAADYTNSLGMQFNNIPAGTFFMGSCLPEGAVCPGRGKADKDAHKGEAPKHEVRISRGFQIGVYEVTLGEFKQYLACLPAGERAAVATDRFSRFNTHGDNAAVVVVSWEDVQGFIRWLNKKEGGRAYRLPTEAEWEYAARAGTETVYFWGDEPEKAPEYAWLNMEGADLRKWFQKGPSGKKEDFPHPVGLKKPNPWGLYDIAGNVWEWVDDWYSEDYYRISPKVDPTGPATGRVRCFRGGSWYGSARNLRSAVRGLNTPDYLSDSLGFRLVRQVGR
ncbi:MAG: formylglycine-generating enzyme family protein [Candidatus Electrothrix sp. YB6]